MLAGVTKDKTFNVRLGAEDLARLQQLADHYGLTISSVIRMLAKQAADALTAAKPIKK